MSQEQLLAQSVARYQAMLDQLEKITEQLKIAHPETIITALEEWNRLQSEAREIDAQIELCQDVYTENTTYQRRSELMNEVARQCRQVQSQAHLLKALVSDELNRLHHGRKAMGGYKGSASRKGGRLSASL